MSTRVEFRGISHRYPRVDHDAVSEVSMVVEPGELLCLVGPSGCGKTTLLKILSGLLEPSKGKVLFNEEDVTPVAPENRRAVMVFQSHLLFPFLSVVENVGFGLRMRGVARAEWEPVARGMLERVRLAGFEERKPANLSGGQQQRVALARALVAEPRVLLLDEPLASLDRHLREDMRQVILDLQRETNVTTVCVTHDQEEAVLLGDRIAMMSDARLVQIGGAQDFYERPAAVHVARFFGNHNQLEARRDGDRVVSELANLRVGPEPAGADWPASGPACVHIRPEAIEIAEASSRSENTLIGVVRHRVYVGTYVRYLVEVGGQPWQVVSSPHGREYDEGEQVSLHLPPQRLWLTRD